MALDTKQIGAGLAAIGALALASLGYLSIQTPEARQCEIELADKKARLELLEERVQLLTDAKDACKAGLEACAGE